MIAALCIGTPTFVDPSSRPDSTDGDVRRARPGSEMIAPFRIGTTTFDDHNSRPSSRPGSTDVAIYAEHARRFR